MNREIKFRAWNTKLKRMAMDVQNEYDTVRGVRYWDNGVISEDEPGETNFGDYLFGDDWVVMQYTGLKDKDGREIFEGDIVRSKLNEIYVVGFGEFDVENDTGYLSTVYGLFLERGRFPRKEALDSYTMNGIQIIGDIHNNPELLK